MSLVTETLDWLAEIAPNEPEYIQAASSLLEQFAPIINANEQYKRANVAQRLLVPNHIHSFKIEWEDDTHQCRVNTGWRVQHSNLLGPYKGGTRFTPTTSQSVLKFLALEQSFKNALTGLTLGAGKGGADFNPKQASPNEIRRFCKAYSLAVHEHIGSHQDVPAGDMGVGSREIGWMYGEYLKLTHQYQGAFSGKPLELGGSQLRTQATGFGVIYFLQQALAYQDKTLEGMRVCISGAGNVALYAAQKAIESGAKVLTLSNSRGVFVNEKGVSLASVAWLIDQSENPQESNANALEALAEKGEGDYLANQTPWQFESDIALPCATQNEIDKESAQAIVDNNIVWVVEGANMPCTQQAEEVFEEASIVHVPGKASNAGGVILSGFEMQQNADFTYRSEEKLDEQLKQAMKNIHDACLKESQAANEIQVNYKRSAVVSGFRALANALLSAGF
jgi:glutamate dehydrogenase (NADP+)